MTVVAGTRATLISTLQAAAPLAGVQILGHPPAESQEIRECVWIESIRSLFEWRTLGGPAHWSRNRTEDLEISVRVDVYREGPSQRTVADSAMDRLEQLVGLIEDALEVDPSLADTVTFGRLAEVETFWRPVDSGWVASARLRYDARHYPPA